MMRRLLRYTMRSIAGCLLAVCLLSAAPQANPDDLIRESTQLIEKNDYELALQLLEAAEERAKDPGLVAFNKACIFWYQNEYRKAENHFRMALDDAAAPVERRAGAFYNLANCLVKQAGDKDFQLLRDAIRYYDFCLQLTTDAKLQERAKHNMEVAKLLWNKARQTSSNPPTPNSDEPADTPRPKPKDKPDTKKEKGSDNGESKDPSKQLDAKQKIEKGNEVADPNGKTKETEAPPQAGPGRLPVIPDSDTLEKRDEKETRASLKETEARLNSVRNKLRGLAAIPERPSGKDW